MTMNEVSTNCGLCYQTNLTFSKKKKKETKKILCSGSMLNRADPIFVINIKIWAQTF